ncbi:MAG: hypothetical protein ACREOG_09895 [Gemmatimonadaceae bacterium]
MGTTKQDVLYFGTPAGDRRFDMGTMPVWVNLRAKSIYGIPGNERRGFKVADNTLGPDVDPKIAGAHGESGEHCHGARARFFESGSHS